MAKKTKNENDTVESQEYVDGTEQELVDPVSEVEVSEKIIPEEPKKSKEELKHEELMKIRAEEAEIFSALKDPKYTNLVSDVYTEMDAYNEMAIEQISYGVLIEGTGGTGKSYRTLNSALKKIGENQVAYADSFTTPQSVYIWFYKGIRDGKKVFILDDCAGLMNNDKILSFIKGFTWDINGVRLMHYMTTKPLQDDEGRMVKNVCDCTGASLIIITNKLNQKNPHVQAVLSRINYCYVDIPRDELMKILDKIIEKPYRDLSFDERKQVLDYLKTNTTNSTENLNIRTMFKMFQFKDYANRHNLGEFWQTLSLKMFKKDDRLALVEKLVNDKQFASENERIEEFRKLTGQSRATYFVLKDQLDIPKAVEKNSEEDEADAS